MYMYHQNICIMLKSKITHITIRFRPSLVLNTSNILTRHGYRFMSRYFRILVSGLPIFGLNIEI